MELNHESDINQIENRILELREQSHHRIMDYAVKNISGHTDLMTIVLKTTSHLAQLMDSILEKFDECYSYSIRHGFEQKIDKMENLGFPEKVISILKEFNGIKSKFREDLSYQLQLPDIQPFDAKPQEKNRTIRQRVLNAYFYTANEMQAILDISSRLPVATAYIQSYTIPENYLSGDKLIPEVSRQLSLISKLKLKSNGEQL